MSRVALSLDKPPPTLGKIVYHYLLGHSWHLAMHPPTGSNIARTTTLKLLYGPSTFHLSDLYGSRAEILSYLITSQSSLFPASKHPPILLHFCQLGTQRCREINVAAGGKHQSRNEDRLMLIS